MVDVKRLLDRLEKLYAEEKSRECEELHNAIAQVLSEKKATIQNTLYVLRMLEFELLQEKYSEIFVKESKEEEAKKPLQVG